MYKRQDEEDCRELKEFSERIKRHLEENGDGEVSVPDIHPYREYHGVPMKPKADKNLSLIHIYAVGNVYPPDLPKALSDCAEAFRDGGLTYSTRYRVRCRDGSPVSYTHLRRCRP